MSGDITHKLSHLEVSSDSDSDSDSDGDVDRTPSGQTESSKTKNLTEKSDIVARYADKIKTDPIKRGPKKTKDRANRATVEQVLDPRTMRFLAKLLNKGVISQVNGCISTGKEANVYHADQDDEEGNLIKEYAVKIYKTSILVFKDRERYVDGEYRFRNSKNQSNPRKMVKLWAEKEFRNLKRLYSHGIPCPEPIDIRSHVLVMEYLSKGNSQPSPKLKDYEFQDEEQIGYFYHQMLFYMRRMYRECKLVHADLSEYNSIVHEERLFIIDVSQSVEHEHPMSLDFLRMDIKNVNDFFARRINVYPERLIFRYVTDHNERLGIENNSDAELERYLETLPLKTEQDGAEDEIFRSTHMVRTLNGLDERDFKKFGEGKITTVTELLGKGEMEKLDQEKMDQEKGEKDQQKDQDPNADEDSDETDSDEGDSDSDSDDDSYSSSEETTPRGKRFEDKDLKKQRKEAARLAKQEKRQTKMKKHIKKKIINKRKK